MTFYRILISCILRRWSVAICFFHREKCELTEKDIDELIHELEEEKKNLKPHSTEP